MTRALLTVGLALWSCGPHAGLQETRAEACGACHAQQYTEWSASRHAQSHSSPVLAALLPRVEAAWGTAARARCVSCHTPSFGGDTTVGCVTCHAAVGNRGELNGALVVDVDAPLAVPPDGGVGAPHATTPRGLLTSASLCGTCHEVHGPGLLLETTLTEFRASGADDTRCAACHLQGTGHRFVGVDPAWGASPEVAATATRASLALLQQALSLTAKGSTLSVKNVGASHAVPTGIALVRDVWVDVELTDEAGAHVWLPRLVELGSRLTRDGVPVSLATDADRIEPRGLAPGEARTVALARTEGLIGQVTAHATLHARALAEGALTALALEARASEVPTFDVAEVTVALP